jgi:hypothetical protein
MIQYWYYIHKLVNKINEVGKKLSFIYRLNKQKDPIQIWITNMKENEGMIKKIIKREWKTKI